mgnify:CR=1 FL=1
MKKYAIRLDNEPVWFIDGDEEIFNSEAEAIEAMAIENHDTVMVPRGYHPCVAPYGYALYYLNTMAGPQRRWAFRNDPNHEWLLR